MASYNLANIIGKNIFAKAKTPLYRAANDLSKPFSSINAGQFVGNVYSYIKPGKNTTKTWLMYYDQQNKPYYSILTGSNIDEKSLKDQGVKTVEEETKAAKQKQEFEEKGAIRYYIEKYAPYLIAALFVVPIAKQLITKK